MLTSDHEVRKYLIDKGWVNLHDTLRIEELSGGVSNQVWKISGPHYRWVMKQALPKLKVQTEWFSDVRRIQRERLVMEALGPLMPLQSVPDVVHHDNISNTYVMTCAPEHSVTWKVALISGDFNAKIALQAGKLLAQFHRESKVLPENAKDNFRDLTFFLELRIDPFYVHLIERYPMLSNSIMELTREYTEEQSCLVHGDYTPKNILITPENDIVLLDYEVSHWGNPVFDIALFTTHLILKGIALYAPNEVMSMIRSFVIGYGPIPGNLIRHLGLNLLARVDGKSPVEYLQEEMKKKVRDHAIKWIVNYRDTLLTDDQLFCEIERFFKGEIPIEQSNKKNPSEGDPGFAGQSDD